MPGEVEQDLQDDSNHIDAHDGGAAPNESSSPADPSGAEITPADDEQDAAGSEGKGPAAEPPKKGKEGRLESVMKILGLKKDGQEQKDQDGKDRPAAGEKPDANDAGAKAGQNKQGKEDGKSDAVPPEVANHPAFKKLQQDLTASSVLARQQTEITNFVRENHIAPENVSAGFRLMALAANAPEDFYNEICKIQQDYAIFLGKSLPADLQDALDAGEINEDRARELSKARIDKQTLEQRNKMSEGRVRETDQRTAQQQDSDLVGRWFDDKAKKDTALKAKTDAIEGEILRLSARDGQPKNQADQLALLNKAYDNVTKRMAVTRQPTRPKPAASGPAPAHRPTGNTNHDKMVSKVEQVLNRRRAN